MHNNVIWQGLLIVVFAVCLWHTGVAYYHHRDYARLNEQVAPTAMTWSVKELSSESFAAQANYHFVSNNRDYSGETLFKDRLQLNHWGAIQLIKEYQTQSWLVWYDITNPNHSSLQKIFPLKEVAIASFLWLLFLYFVFLGCYVAKFKTK